MLDAFLDVPMYTSDSSLNQLIFSQSDSEQSLVSRFEPGKSIDRLDGLNILVEHFVEIAVQNRSNQTVVSALHMDNACELFYAPNNATSAEKTAKDRARNEAVNVHEIDRSVLEYMIGIWNNRMNESDLFQFNIEGEMISTSELGAKLLAFLRVSVPNYLYSVQGGYAMELWDYYRDSGPDGFWEKNIRNIIHEGTEGAIPLGAAIMEMFKDPVFESENVKKEEAQSQIIDYAGRYSEFCLLQAGDTSKVDADKIQEFKIKFGQKPPGDDTRIATIEIDFKGAKVSVPVALAEVDSRIMEVYDLMNQLNYIKFAKAIEKLGFDINGYLELMLGESPDICTERMNLLINSCQDLLSDLPPGSSSQDRETAITNIGQDEPLNLDVINNFATNIGVDPSFLFRFPVVQRCRPGFKSMATFHHALCPPKFPVNTDQVNSAYLSLFDGEDFDPLIEPNIGVLMMRDGLRGSSVNRAGFHEKGHAAFASFSPIDIRAIGICPAIMDVFPLLFEKQVGNISSEFARYIDVHRHYWPINHAAHTRYQIAFWRSASEIATRFMDEQGNLTISLQELTSKFLQPMKSEYARIGTAIRAQVDSANVLNAVTLTDPIRNATYANSSILSSVLEDKLAQAESIDEKRAVCRSFVDTAICGIGPQSIMRELNVDWNTAVAIFKQSLESAA